MQHEENKWIIYQSWLRSDFSRVMNWGVVELRTGFFLIFSLLSIPLLSLSPFLCIWTARSLHYTQGNYWSMEEPLANCSRLIDPEALTPRSVTLVERKPVLLLVVSLLDLCIKTRVFCVLIQPPPPSFPKNVCVFTYSNKAFLCIKSFWVKF